MTTHEKNENETAPPDPPAPEVAATGSDEPQATEAPAGDLPARDEASHQAVGIGVVGSGDGADHYGQDEGRETLTAGQAQRQPGALGTEQEQRLPAMSQNDASAVEKVSGIVAQTRQDVGTESVERIAQVLAQRLDQSGVSLPDAEVHELAQQISTGDASAPDQS